MKLIRVTSREELEACFKIRVKVFVEEQQVPADLEIDEFDAGPEACRHVLLLDGEGKPCATGRWREYEHGAAKLQRIAVLSDYRGQGLGRVLVQGLEAWAKAEERSSSVLDAQVSAEGFYSRLGYRTVEGEPFLDAGILHVRMTKELL